MRPSLCLSMIVRDEAHVIEETLRCVAPHIAHWVIVDTGSVDATPSLVESFFARHRIPGELHRRPWRDFGSNRTEALELARGTADYVWTIDADDLVVGAIDFTGLDRDAYLLRYGRDFRYWRKQVLRGDRRWRYVGVLHEYVECLDGEASEAKLEGDYFIDSRRLGARNRAPDKYRRDAELLAQAVERDPRDARSRFYLAQSWADAGEPRRALAEYEARAAMGGWAEETFYSLLQAARLRERLGEDAWSVTRAYLEAFRFRPSRAEPLYEIARGARQRQDWSVGSVFAEAALRLPPSADLLFVAADVEAWRARDEAAICAFHAGDVDRCYELSTQILASPDLPEAERPRIEGNRDFAVPARLPRTAVYPEVVVRRLERAARRRRRATPEVMLSITSCKRLALFETTVNSFLNCCTDVERIGRFVCVDDNSSPADRRRMRKLYPFFEFVMKGPARRGHVSSMNLVLDRLGESPYWLHLEDDWHFFVDAGYVEPAREILAADPRLGQVLYNRNYAETLADRELHGGEVDSTPRGARFRRHRHLPRESPEWQAYLAALPAGGRTNAWWPHYSLRPALVRGRAAREVGRFSPAAGHFELEYAERFTARGWRAAFFDEVRCLHIGRLTGSDSGENAYVLNRTPQFVAVSPRAVAPAPRRTPAIRPGARLPVTLVTGFLDLSRRETRGAGRRAADYLEYGRWLLAQPVPLVVFADRGHLDDLRRLRPRSAPTRWVGWDLEDCRWWPRRGAIETALRERPVRHSDVEKDTAAYLITGYQKTEWLEVAAGANPFGSGRLAWIDFGTHGLADRDRLTTREDLDAGLAALVAGRHARNALRVCAIEPVAAEVVDDPAVYYAEHRWPVAAGLLEGSPAALRWFAGRVRREIAACLDAGIAITEEMIWGRILQLEPRRFAPHYGTWASCLANVAGPRRNVSEVLSAARRASRQGAFRASARRLDFVGAERVAGDPDLWFAYWDERFLTDYYLGRLDRSRRALFELWRGALADPARRERLEPHAERLIRNAAFLIPSDRRDTFTARLTTRWRRRPR
jgi:glycosyltransferase involved in cell wall biosynthesis